MEGTSNREPRVMLCRAQVGFRGYFSLMIIGSAGVIITVAAGGMNLQTPNVGDSTTKPITGLVLAQGLVAFIAATVGLSAVVEVNSKLLKWKPKAKQVKNAFVTYLILHIIFLAITITSFAITPGRVSADMQTYKSEHPSTSDSQMNDYETSAFRTMMIGGLVLTIFPLGLAAWVYNRMYVYYKWMVSVEKLSTAKLGEK